MSKKKTYDFLGSIYKKTTYEELDLCFSSIVHQTYKPKKIILVIDGPINLDIKKIIKKYSHFLKIKLIKLEKNMGLGLALRYGLKFCTSKYILRFDSDDYNLPYRAEKQIKFMESKNLDISSSSVYEFIDHPDNIRSIKNIPLTDSEIRRTLPFRNPFNHPSICFKLSSIIKIDGGYRDFPSYEDYDLWIRALSKGLICGNLKDKLVAMKVDNLIKRRKGINKIILEAKLLKTFWDNSFKNFLLFIPSYIIRSVIKLMPLRIIIFIYKNFLRS